MFFAFAGLLNAQGATPSSGGSGGWAALSFLIGLVVGGGLIYGSIVNGRKAQASLQWPSVPGTVLYSQLVRDSTSGSGDVETFSPVITYTYIVNGQGLQCSRVNFSGTKSKKQLATYPKGIPVQVYYDPQQPTTAVLEKGGSTKVMLFVGIAVIAFGCVVALVMAVAS